MKQKFFHSKVTKIEYEFLEWEVREALIKKYDIKPGVKMDFALGYMDEDKDHPTVLTVYFEEEDKR